MSSMLLAALAAWLTVGVIAVVLLHHRGHDVFSWSVLFVFLGPLAIPLAISAQRHMPAQPDWPLHAGAVDVLAAHDGSVAADEALRAALALLGDRITSVTLAAVVDAEAATTVRGKTTCAEAQRRLDAAAHRFASATGAPVDSVVLFGESHRVLSQFASDHGYELVVGCEASAKAGSVPVLIGAVSR